MLFFVAGIQVCSFFFFFLFLYFLVCAAFCVCLVAMYVCDLLPFLRNMKIVQTGGLTGELMGDISLTFTVADMCSEQVALKCSSRQVELSRSDVL